MNEAFYNIAGIVIRIVSPFPFYAANGEDFRCPPAEPDFSFRFEKVDDIPRLMEGAEMVENLFWAHEYRREDGTFLRAFLWQEQFYTEVSVIGKGEGVCYFLSADILMDRAREGFELLMYLCLEQILMQFDALVLHSSQIVVGDKALVFSAPTQTGKSTQAELWRQYAGALVVNGDRSVLRKFHGRWHACGCPMCGTSGIHLQSKKPLSHIVMLSQSRENTVRKLPGREAFRLLYPQITVSGWNAAYIDRALALLNDLLAEVGVWHYACTKEPDAVTTLRDALGL